MDEQHHKQGGGGQHRIDCHGNPQITALIAGGGQDALVHVADEHDGEDDEDVGDGPDDAVGNQLHIGGQVPHLVVDTQETLQQTHPGTEEHDGDQAHQQGLAGLAPVDGAVAVRAQGKGAHAGGYARLFAAVGGDDHADNTDGSYYEQPAHNAVKIVGGQEFRPEGARARPLHHIGRDMDKD